MFKYTFLSTKKLVGPYKFLIKSCIIHFQEKFKIDAQLDFLILKEKILKHFYY